MNKDIKIHPTADVSKEAQIGRGSSIWQYCIIQSDVKIGEFCSLGANVYVESGVRLGNRVKVKNNITIYSGVICEDDVFLGPNCVFTNVINPRSFINRKNEFRQTYIQKGATIGANATIICGHKIGKYAMIGAGTVITKDVPDYALVVGNPGRLQSYVCECGVKLIKVNSAYECENCKKKYIYDNGLKEQI